MVIVILVLRSPATLRLRSIGSLKTVDDCLLVGKINAGNIPVILGVPAHCFPYEIHSGDVVDLDLVLLVSHRLGEGNGVGRILLADANSKLLTLLINEELHEGRVPQLLRSLDVELDDVAREGDNRSGTGLDEINDSELFQHGELLLFNIKIAVLLDAVGRERLCYVGGPCNDILHVLFIPRRVNDKESGKGSLYDKLGLPVALALPPTVAFFLDDLLTSSQSAFSMIGL